MQYLLYFNFKKDASRPQSFHIKTFPLFIENKNGKIIFLEQSTRSKYALKISQNRSGFILKTNPVKNTFTVNGAKVRNHVLRSDDTIELEDHQIKVSILREFHLDSNDSRFDSGITPCKRS